MARPGEGMREEGVALEEGWGEETEEDETRIPTRLW